MKIYHPGLADCWRVIPLRSDRNLAEFVQVVRALLDWWVGGLNRYQLIGRFVA